MKRWKPGELAIYESWFAATNNRNGKLVLVLEEKKEELFCANQYKILIGGDIWWVGGEFLIEIKENKE